jgi:hypothetical protein
MQALTRTALALRGVRRVMGKPFAGESWEDIYRPTPKVKEEPIQQKFSKSFQAYLDSRLTLEDLMKAEDEKKKATPAS